MAEPFLQFTNQEKQVTCPFMLKAGCKQSLEFVSLVYLSNGIDIFRPVTLVQKAIDPIELQELNHDVGTIVGSTCAAESFIP